MSTPLPVRSALILTAVVALGATGCATPGDPKSTRADASRLTLSEIQSVEQPTAYEVIRWLRPDWLRSRGAGFSEPSTATVYVDGLNRGGLESLQHVSRDDIQQIRFLHAADATTLFGTNNMGGAIVINTRF